eukprot:4322529-Alexandrium_andersonii.AAC.1
MPQRCTALHSAVRSHVQTKSTTTTIHTARHGPTQGSTEVEMDRVLHEQRVVSREAVDPDPQVAVLVKTHEEPMGVLLDVNRRLVCCDDLGGRDHELAWEREQLDVRDP